MADGPERATEPLADDDEPLAVVRAALEGLDPPARVPAATVTDSDRMTDVLLDHASRLDGRRLLEYLTLLQGLRFVARFREHCSREFLLLDSAALAEDAIVRVFVGWLDGQRVSPFERWATRIVHETASAATTDAEFAQLEPPGSSPAERLVLRELALLVNQQSSSIRKMVWLSFVDGLSMPAIASRMDVPLERVEWLLASILDQAQESIRKTLRGLGRITGALGSGDRDDVDADDGEEQA